jgi:hypothetical protein
MGAKEDVNTRLRSGGYNLDEKMTSTEKKENFNILYNVLQMYQGMINLHNVR